MPMRDERGLVELFQLDIYTIKELASSCRSGTAYNEFKTRKKSTGSTGEYRTINVPTPLLKQVQEVIKDGILKGLPVSTSATAYVKGRSTKLNASYHVQAKVVGNLDIRNFFGSIKRKQVHLVFAKCGWCMKAAWLLTDLTTLNGSLPQGSSCSPYLSNLVMVGFDRKVYDYCSTIGVAYSRYSDDLSFSGNLSLDVIDAMSYTKEQLELMGFQVREDKTTLLYPHERQEVTGLVTNWKPRPPKTQRGKGRAIMHNHPKSAQAQGWRAYLNDYEV